MSDLAPADKVPEMRPKRPVYTTYTEIIRTLIAAAQGRVRQDKQPDPLPPVPNTAKIRRLVKRYVQARKDARKAEHLLHRLNIDPDENGSWDWTYSHKNRLNEKPGAARQTRMDKIQQLRVKAAVDTMDMTPAQAKKYLLKLERQLAAI